MAKRYSYKPKTLTRLHQSAGSEKGKQIMKTLTIKQIREMLRNKFDRYAIRQNGDVHVWGVMPNTNEYGCYLLCTLADLQRNPEYYI